jgi:hypothetical protein
MRQRGQSTCGGNERTVTCCGMTSRGSEVCSLAHSEARCEASRRGTGRVGRTESCYDACLPPPTPTPSPTPTASPPTVTPIPEPTDYYGLGQRCVCTCDQPYTVYGCWSFHPCVVMSFVPTTPAECDPLDTPNRVCHYHSDVPPPWPESTVDFCQF